MQFRKLLNFSQMYWEDIQGKTLWPQRFEGLGNFELYWHLPLSQSSTCKTSTSSTCLWLFPPESACTPSVHFYKNYYTIWLLHWFLKKIPCVLLYIITCFTGRNMNIHDLGERKAVYKWQDKLTKSWRITSEQKNPNLDAC